MLAPVTPRPIMVILGFAIAESLKCTVCPSVQPELYFRVGKKRECGTPNCCYLRPEEHEGDAAESRRRLSCRESRCILVMADEPAGQLTAAVFHGPFSADARVLSVHIGGIAPPGVPSVALDALRALWRKRLCHD